jgi:hypothetical protein
MENTGRSEETQEDMGKWWDGRYGEVLNWRSSGNTGRHMGDTKEIQRDFG